MIERAAIVALLFGVCLGCERKAPETGPTNVVVSEVGATSTGGAAEVGGTAEPEPAPTFSGSPVAVAPPTVLHEADGFRIERQSWRCDGVAGTAWRARLSLEAAVGLEASDSVKPFRDFLPGDDGPWVAINGGFYEAIPNSTGYRPMGLVVADGKEVSSLTVRGGSGVFYVEDGTPKIVHRKGFRGSPTAALQSIDRIIAGGQSLVSKKPGASQASRSAVIVGESHLWFVTAAADADITPTSTGASLARSGAGLTLWAFAEYLLATTDGVDALNLDGGVSTQLAARHGEFELYVDGVRGTVNVLVARGSDAE